MSSSPIPSSELSSHISRVPWLREDEQRLVSIGLSLGLSIKPWPLVESRFNNGLPVERQRSRDALKCKWTALGHQPLGGNAEGSAPSAQETPDSGPVQRPRPSSSVQATSPASFLPGLVPILPKPALQPILEPSVPAHSSGSLAPPTTYPPTVSNLPRRRSLRKKEGRFVYPPPPRPDDPFYGWMGADSAPTGGFRGPYYGKAIGK